MASWRAPQTWVTARGSFSWLSLHYASFSPPPIGVGFIIPTECEIVKSCTYLIPRVSLVDSDSRRCRNSTTKIYVYQSLLAAPAGIYLPCTSPAPAPLEKPLSRTYLRPGFSYIAVHGHPCVVYSSTSFEERGRRNRTNHTHRCSKVGCSAV